VSLAANRRFIKIDPVPIRKEAPLRKVKICEINEMDSNGHFPGLGGMAERLAVEE
jgi:hypothetical protein